VPVPTVGKGQIRPIMTTTPDITDLILAACELARTVLPRRSASTLPTESREEPAAGQPGPPTLASKEALSPLIMRRALHSSGLRFDVRSPMAYGRPGWPRTLGECLQYLAYGSPDGEAGRPGSNCAIRYCGGGHV